MEDRLLLATYMVINTADSGPGSLRDAINKVNGDSSSDTIDFNIAGAGTQTISLLSALPTIVNSVTIDGTCQPGYSGAPLIVLDGTSAGAGANGLRITAGNSTVSGLVIDNFTGNGIELETRGGDTIQGNYIGVDPTGSTSEANGGDGILVNGAPNNTIGGLTSAAENLVSANTVEGIMISGPTASGNLIVGNLVGLNVNGLSSLDNTGDGVSISDAGHNTIGSTASGAANTISGNTGAGIIISGATASDNLIQANLIGTDGIGLNAQPNAEGVVINGASGNSLGGLISAAANIISGNSGPGVSISGSTASGNLLQGNLIGTNLVGNQSVANSGGGVQITGAFNKAARRK